MICMFAGFCGKDADRMQLTLISKSIGSEQIPKSMIVALGKLPGSLGKLPGSQGKDRGQSTGSSL